MPNPVVPPDVRSLAGQLAQPRLMRRGSVSERYVKCNKAGCACADSADARHEPYYSVSHVVKGRTQSRWLDAEQATLVRQQVEAGQEFRQHVIGVRCKRAGMHWTVAGADAIIALRCCKLSGRFEDFWERRAQRRLAA